MINKQPLTKREQARFRAIVKKIASLRAKGWTPETHPDFEPLTVELAALSDKLTRDTA